MFKLLIVASIVVAGLFVLHSSFRRRFFWSIKVTLGIYAFAFAVRLVIWPFLGFDESGDVYTAVAGVLLVCAAIWLLARWLSTRYIDSRKRRRPAARSGRRSRLSSFRRR